MSPERFESLKAHWAKMKRECGYNFDGWDDAVAHIDALQAEVARLTEELKATKLARGQPEHYTVELIEARAEVAQLWKAKQVLRTALNKIEDEPWSPKSDYLVRISAIIQDAILRDEKISRPTPTQSGDKE